jgi:hypothetical protein
MRTQVCANQCMENGSVRSFRDLLTVPLSRFREHEESKAPWKNYKAPLTIG